MLYEIILEIAGPEIKCALEASCQKHPCHSVITFIMQCSCVHQELPVKHIGHVPSSLSTVHQTCMHAFSIKLPCSS